MISISLGGDDVCCLYDSVDFTVRLRSPQCNLVLMPDLKWRE